MFGKRKISPTKNQTAQNSETLSQAAYDISFRILQKTLQMGCGQKPPNFSNAYNQFNTQLEIHGWETTTHTTKKASSIVALQDSTQINPAFLKEKSQEKGIKRYQTTLQHSAIPDSFINLLWEDQYNRRFTLFEANLFMASIPKTEMSNQKIKEIPLSLSLKNLSSGTLVTGQYSFRSYRGDGISALYTSFNPLPKLVEKSQQENIPLFPKHISVSLKESLQFESSY